MALLQDALTEILKGFPAEDYALAGALCRKLLDGGAATIEKLVETVGDRFGDPEGVQAKYAVHGLVHYASRGGAAADRKLLAETLAAQLSGAHSDELKAFVVRQLQLCGRAEEVPALAKLLASERLCKPAVQALQAIGGDEALQALRDALPQASGACKEAIGLAVAILSQS